MLFICERLTKLCILVGKTYKIVHLRGRLPGDHLRFIVPKSPHHVHSQLVPYTLASAPQVGQRIVVYCLGCCTCSLASAMTKTITRIMPTINAAPMTSLLFLFSVSHLFGQAVQALVVLRLRDRAVFKEGCQQRHLPVVEGFAFFLRALALRFLRYFHNYHRLYNTTLF